MEQKRDNLRMRKYLLLLFLTIGSGQLIAASSTSVRVRTDYDLVVSGTTNKSFEIGTSSNGDGSAETDPARIYIPMDGPLAGAADELNYFIEPGVTRLFSASSTDTISFPLYLNSTSNDYYLYMAIKDPTAGYKIVSSVASPFNDKTNLDYNFSITPLSMCTQTADCTAFAVTSGTEKTYLSYFFLSTDTPVALPIGTTITPGSGNHTGGMYYEINMSNRIFTAAQVTMTISEIRAGDRRVIVNYSSSASILKPKAIRLYNHGGTAAAVSANQPIQSYLASGGALLSNEFTYTDAGEITLSNLINGTTAYYSVLAVDKYKFGTVLSEDIEGSSKSIEELLKANNCFLLTAGFGENHFVIDYFRDFRDRVLVKTFLGKKFISFYYELAPKYALVLYNYESIRGVVRGLAYGVYFIFKYNLFILIGALISGLGLFLYKKQEKIKT